MAQTPHPIQRLAAALAACALALSLLAVAAPVRAALASEGDPASHQIGTGGAGCVGAVPSAPERSRVAPQGLAILFAAVVAPKPAEPPAERTSPLTGGTPPRLSRWRLAHATSTANP
jgi:hypothetical protein